MYHFYVKGCVCATSIWFYMSRLSWLWTGEVRLSGKLPGMQLLIQLATMVTPGGTTCPGMCHFAWVLILPHLYYKGSQWSYSGRTSRVTKATFVRNIQNEPIEMVCASYQEPPSSGGILRMSSLEATMEQTQNTLEQIHSTLVGWEEKLEDVIREKNIWITWQR